MEYSSPKRVYTVSRNLVDLSYFLEYMELDHMYFQAIGENLPVAIESTKYDQTLAMVSKVLPSNQVDRLAVMVPTITSLNFYGYALSNGWTAAQYTTFKRIIRLHGMTEKVSLTRAFKRDPNVSGIYILGDQWLTTNFENMHPLVRVLYAPFKDSDDEWYLRTPNPECIWQHSTEDEVRSMIEESTLPHILRLFNALMANQGTVSYSGYTSERPS